MSISNEEVRRNRLRYFDKEEEKCPICYEKINSRESLGSHCCGDHGKKHYFHTHCLMQWMETRNGNTCPICRGNIDINMERAQEILNNSLEPENVIKWLTDLLKNNSISIINNMNNNENWSDLNGFEKTGVTTGFLSFFYLGNNIGRKVIETNNSKMTMISLYGTKYMISNNI